MIHTVRIAGQETEILCDLNVLGELLRLYGRLGDVEAAAERIPDACVIAALMINEAHEAAGRAERVRPRELGRRITFPELAGVQSGCMAALIDCLDPGRALSPAPKDDEGEPEWEDPEKKQTPQGTR